MYKVVQAQKPIQSFNGIMLLGEAPGADECIEGRPFVGASGKLLNGLLKFAGIERNACYITNVFQTRPPRNDLTAYFRKPKNAAPEDKELFYQHREHGFLIHAHHPELLRLLQEIETVQPKLIVCLGATALWALTGITKITAYRGTVMEALGIAGHAFSKPYKIVATFHPAAAIRDYSFRPIIACDLQKALEERDVVGIVRPKRKVNIIETTEDVDICVADALSTRIIAWDVETERRAKQITCLSIAPSSDRAYVFPFWNMNNNNYSHFDFETELYCWAGLARILHDHSILKIAHNATYDLTYAEGSGIKVSGKVEDTMLMSHSYQVEWPKALGFLGSIYCNEQAWKNLRVGAVKDRNKPNE